MGTTHNICMRPALRLAAAARVLASTSTSTASKAKLAPTAGFVNCSNSRNGGCKPSSSKMGKKKGPSAPESSLLMPLHDALKSSQKHLPIIDTHCHLFSTYSFYKTKYPEGEQGSVQDFVRTYMRQQTST